MSNQKTDLIATAITAALYMNIPGDLTRVQSMIYISLYFWIVKTAVKGIKNERRKRDV